MDIPVKLIDELLEGYSNPDADRTEGQRSTVSRGLDPDGRSPLQF